MLPGFGRRSRLKRRKISTVPDVGEQSGRPVEHLLYLWSMTSEQWLLIVVPVLTGGFALAGSWYGSLLGRNNEHKQWLRNQKQSAYSEFLGAFDALYLETGLSKVEDQAVQELLFSLVAKQGRLSVVGAPEVTKLSDRLVDESWAMAQAARGIGPDAGNRFGLRETAKETGSELLEGTRLDLGVATKR
jgi:hypothetical protein